MSSESLLNSACSKLLSVVDKHVDRSTSLHRWVLLKNSILRSHTLLPAPDKDEAEPVYRHEDSHEEVEQDSFMFPDPSARGRDAGSGEDQWLDAILEDLGDDEDVDVEDSLIISHPPALQEDDEPLSPMYSPMSSSDDLADNSSFYYPPEIAIPYPVPYPPLHPSLVPDWLELDSSPEDSSLTPSPPLYHDPLPYFHSDDIDDLSVPDAIEDTSDDESDSPSTPSLVSTTSLSPPESFSRERTRLRQPHVYIDTDDSYFYPFEIDPLPFPNSEHNDDARPFTPIFQEC
ncbi:hypothetical protein K474DRAFT_968824 [Panus rudis PR-1116 ss-1]|nr:hypothetical protein K474DRAFT_968824 [Panus rudis PR-1116 ss-1]